jgi:hypothetical protein
MDQLAVIQNTSPKKKSNKACIIVVLVLIALCICCVLPIAGGVGLFYLAPDTIKEYVPEDVMESLEKDLGPILEDLPVLDGEDTSSNEAVPQDGESSSNGVPTQQEMEEIIGKMGVAEIPFELTVPDGMQIIQKAAFVAPLVEDPKVSALYFFALLENDTAVVKAFMPYTLYCYNSSNEYGPYATGAGDQMWLTIPVQQSGVLESRRNPYASWSYPVKLEASIEPLDSPERQASLDKLNDTTLPNPYFTVVSAEFNAEQLPSGFYNITATGKFTNNLPVNNFAQGLFIFYDENDQIISFVSSNWGGHASAIIEPNAEGEITAPLPYPIAVEPARVEFIPYIDVMGGVNLQD